MRKLLWIAAAWLLQGNVLLYAQSSVQVEQILDKINSFDDEPDDSEWIESLEFFSNNPLNINTVSDDTLRMLGLMSERQIENLASFKRTHGALTDLAELLLVNGFSESDLAVLSPFFTLSETALPIVAASKFHNECLLRTKRIFPLQEGYKSYSREECRSDYHYQQKLQNRYVGSPYATMLRAKVRNAGWQCGITVERDAGEPFFQRGQSVDFCSAHIAYSSDKVLRRLLVGDFRMAWGQGLVLWNVYSMGKSVAGQGLEKVAREPSPYTSVSESDFLRGVATSWRLSPKSRVEAFFSYKPCDGTVNQDGFATLSATGYHRSAGELARRHTLHERSAGVAWLLNTHRVRVGCHALWYDFSSPLLTRNYVYRRYADDGGNRTVVGADYKWQPRAWAFAGEVAVTEKGHWAMLHTVRWMGRAIALNALWRYYDRRYQSRYARGFAEYSGTTNEEGLFVSLDWQLSRNWRMNLFADFFNYFAPRYQALVPRAGNEWGLLVERELHGVGHQLRARFEQRPEGSALQWQMRRKASIRYRFSARLSERWALQSVVEGAFYEKGERESGLYVAQDVVFAASKWGAQLRLACFDTDSYQSRIYTIEHNPLSMSCFSSFYDSGIRAYLNMNVQLAKNYKLYMKGGWLHYFEKSTIGSGVTSVDGKNMWDTTLQLQCRF